MHPYKHVTETKKKIHDPNIFSLDCCCTLVTLYYNFVKAEQIICICILKVAKQGLFLPKYCSENIKVP